MKGLIMLNKIKGVFFQNNYKQITIEWSDNTNSFSDVIKNLFNFNPKFARQEIRIEKSRKSR